MPIKIEREKITLPNEITSLMKYDEDNPIPTMSGEDIEEKRVQIVRYIQSSREHLEDLKEEIYRTIDENYPDKTDTFETDPDSLADYSTKPSVFMEKAYTIQCYDKTGKELENREQAYINAGKDFSQYCRDNADNMTDVEVVLNDAGTMIAAVNSTLSQLNKVEAHLVKNEYEIAGGALPVLPYCIQAVLNSANESKLVEISIKENKSGPADTRTSDPVFNNSESRSANSSRNPFNQILSGLTNILSGFRNFLSSLGKARVEQNITTTRAAKDIVNSHKANAPDNRLDNDSKDESHMTPGRKM